MMHLIRNSEALPILVEGTAFPGVRRIADKIALDIAKVTGHTPAIVTEAEGPCILCATLGQSPAIDALIAAGKLPQAAEIRGGWERYAIAKVDDRLIICGSDKRGTIYGMFALSAYIGVSPLCYWGDVEPLRQEDVILGDDIETVSKEPSVRYRGFFINDEWPCFGTWTNRHFGGFTAEMYDHVFELLLRLKGNYFWPAMWASVFGEEGPGIANEELADLYGVVVGNSHHEPCLRAGEEFKRSIQAGGEYGDVWNFTKNREGITRFWADGLKRSGKYEHLVTIGMRGEADSAMLGENASLRANIEYLKDVITTQEALIREHCAPKVIDAPRVLALYKEVEPFFYGNAEVEGLKDWDGLRNTVCMLCEDNHGFMRSLPTPEMTASLKARGCGFGMYYHLDYHGDPFSYEWMPSTPFSKLWDQMCMAYEYGIRDVWIVNVGDLKGNEVGLAQFLDLAYDFDRWGDARPDNWEPWVTEFVRATFPGMSEDDRADTEWLLTDYIAINGKRRPEALHAGVYHPCHETETWDMLDWANDLEETNDRLMAELTGETRLAYENLVGHPLRASMNLLRMHLYAGLNAHYAAQGRHCANAYADLTGECIRRDRELNEAYAAFREGKWSGMEQEEHIGFTAWNDWGCRMPLRTCVTPFHSPRLTLSRQDDEKIYLRVYGQPMRMKVDDFCDKDVSCVILEVANDGEGTLDWRIEGAPQWQAEGNPWLTLSATEGTVEAITNVAIYCDRSQLTAEKCSATLRCVAGDATVLIDVTACEPVCAEAGVSMPRKGVVTIEAGQYAAEKKCEAGAFRVLNGFGRSGQGVKVYPCTAAFAPDGDAPSLTYRFQADAPGAYTAELWLTPTSPVQPGVPMRCTVTGPDGVKQLITTVAADYRAGDPREPRWCAAVTDHIRKVPVEIACEAGVQTLEIGAVDPGLILERIVIYPKGMQIPQSYLGAEASPLS